MFTFRQKIASNNAHVIARTLTPVLALMLSGSLSFAAPDKKAPTKPSNFRVTAATAYSFSVAWQSSSDNSGNFSYVLADTASPSERVTLPKTATSFTFSRSLYPGRSYTAIIQAVDAAGNASSAVGVGVTLPADITPPTTAPVLSVTDVGARHVGLAWSKPQDDAPVLTYQVFLNGNPYFNTGTNMEVSFTSLQPGTTYTFSVQGRDYGGNLSPMSSVVTVATLSAPTDTTPPTTPTNFGDNGMSFADGETWLFWTQATDDQSAQSAIRYDVFANGAYEGSLFGSGGPFIVYAELGALNTFEVIAVDEEGNESSPATYTVDLR